MGWGFSGWLEGTDGERRVLPKRRAADLGLGLGQRTMMTFQRL